MNKTLALLSLAIAACGSSDSGLDLSSRDPRCVAACPETMPTEAGVGAVCDEPSRSQCLDECEARIAGLPTVCQNCLVEDACFDPDGCVGDEGESCDQNGCTLTTSFGTCTYDPSNAAAKLACEQKTDPRRDVACEASFKETTKCASVCPS